MEDAHDAPESAADAVTETADAASIPDDAMAAEVAARGFVASAWAGALVLTWSYGQLYWAVLSGIYSSEAAFTIGVLSAILGGVMFVRSRRVWQALGLGAGRKSMTVALVVAGAGGVFWLLFALLLVLFYAGVDILPV